MVLLYVLLSFLCVSIWIGGLAVCLAASRCTDAGHSYTNHVTLHYTIQNMSGVCLFLIVGKNYQSENHCENNFHTVYLIMTKSLTSLTICFCDLLPLSYLMRKHLCLVNHLLVNQSHKKLEFEHRGAHASPQSWIGKMYIPGFECCGHINISHEIYSNIGKIPNKVQSYTKLHKSTIYVIYFHLQFYTLLAKYTDY